MRISVLQENLLRALTLVTRAVPSRTSLPVLNNVLLRTTDDNRLVLNATNLELFISTSIGAKVEEPGDITIPANTFIELVKMLPQGRIDLSLDNASQTLLMEAEGSKTKFKGTDASEFPAQAAPPENLPMLQINGGLFNKMIEQVIFACGKEDARPILTGACMEWRDSILTLKAADGFRVAIRSETLDQTDLPAFQAIIPAKTLAELRHAFTSDDNIYIVLNKNQMFFETATTRVTAQLIDGTYPDVNAVIPKAHTTHVQVYKSELLMACKRSEIFARDANHSTRVEINAAESRMTPGQVIIRAQSQEKGDNTGQLDASVEGKNVTITLNVRYLIDTLNAIPDEQVIIETEGPITPSTIRPNNSEIHSLYLVMPMANPN